MPYLDTAQQWLTQSHLLLQARPSTTRITTKYTIKPPSSSTSKPRKTKSTPTPSTTEPTTTTQQDPTPAPPPPRATLTLKTHDSASGTTLKYETTKAAEVSRLIQILGRLGRGMVGMAEVKEEGDVVMGDEGTGIATPVIESVGNAVGAVKGAVMGQDKGLGQSTGGGGGGGGGKGKKKGKGGKK